MFLTGGIMASIAVLILILILVSDFIVGYIPFSWEQYLSEPFTKTDTTDSDKDDFTAIETYLQKMSDRIAITQDLPEGMTIKIHYIDKDSVNAFATLGGHVFFYRGLLEKLPHENALTMVMAHEIAHIKYRHPIHSLGRGILVGLTLSVISSSAGDAIMDGFLNEAGILTVLKFGRDMERESDKEAVNSLVALYGHMKGGDDLFKVLQQQNKNSEPYEFFSTHPLTDNRISSIRQQSDQHPASEAATITPLPEAFSDWVTSKKTEQIPLPEQNNKTKLQLQ